MAFATSFSCAKIEGMHPGLPDAVLMDVQAAGRLPDELANNIDTLIQVLMSANLSRPQRYSTLTQLINHAIKYRPTNFKEYVWFVRFTSSMLLLQNVPLPFGIKQSLLLTHTFQIRTDEWSSCPVKIHVVAKALFEQLDDDYNLVSLVQLICNRSRLSYYVSVALIWAAIYRFVNRETVMFRIHKISDLINLLETIDMQAIENRLADLHRFVTILSVFQSLVILRKPRYEEYVCFRKFFMTNDSDMNLLNDWLEKLKSQVEYICSRNQRDNDDCLQLIEMLDLNILHFMKQILKPEDE